jgi:hypothetical protein
LDRFSLLSGPLVVIFSFNSETLPNLAPPGK